jgi:hypothetical protein
MADENIRIQLTAVDKTRSGLASVTRGLRSVTGAVFSMRTAIASLVGVGGLGLVVKQSLNATDALGKTARRIGTTAADLRRLQFAAELSGLSIEQTNMALQRFSRRVAEASRGTGEAQGVIRELGLDAKELADIPLSEAMLAVANAMEGVQGNTQQLRIAFKLFDSEGAGMVNMLNQGSEAMRAMFNEAESLGMILSAEAVAGVEATNDALTKLGYLFRGIRDQLVAALAPALTQFADFIKTYLLEQINALNGGIEELARNTIADFLRGLGAMIGGIGSGIQAFVDFGNSIIHVANAIIAISNRFSDGSPFAEIPMISNDMAVSFGAAQQKLEELANAVQNGTAVLTQHNEGAEQTVSVYDRIAAAMQMALDTVPTLDQAITSFTQGAMNSFTDAFTSAITGAKSFADAVKDMARSVVNSLIKMLVQYYITKPLFDAITGFVGGLGGGGAAPTGRAVGGPVSSGTPYIVGENGPELFIPSSGGQVQPNGRMGGGGVTVNQNINISTGVAQTVRAEVLNLMPQIAESAKAAVADSRMRGGGYSKALIGM